MWGSVQGSGKEKGPESNFVESLPGDIKLKNEENVVLAIEMSFTKHLLILDVSVPVSSVHASFPGHLNPSSQAELSDPWGGPPFSHHPGSIYLLCIALPQQIGSFLRSGPGSYLVIFVQGLG